MKKTQKISWKQRKLAFLMYGIAAVIVWAAFTYSLTLLMLAWLYVMFGLGADPKSKLYEE